jgi:hypothetical protein
MVSRPMVPAPSTRTTSSGFGRVRGARPWRGGEGIHQEGHLVGEAALLPELALVGHQLVAPAAAGEGAEAGDVAEAVGGPAADAVVAALAGRARLRALLPAAEHGVDNHPVARGPPGDGRPRLGHGGHHLVAECERVGAVRLEGERVVGRDDAQVAAADAAEPGLEPDPVGARQGRRLDLIQAHESQRARWPAPAAARGPREHVADGSVVEADGSQRAAPGWGRL